MNRDDSNTLRLLQERNSEFLENIFLETNPYLFKILGAHRFNGDVAQDLAQQAWETFFTNLDRFKGQSQIKVFVAGILINKIREYRRLLKKTIYEEDAEKIYEQAFTADGWWINEPADPAALLHSKQIGLYIEECMEGLSDSQREAFVLREINDENSEQICNILQLSVSNLGVLIYRAKDKLRKCLEGKVR